MTRGRKYSRREIILEIKRLHKKLGRRPVKRDSSSLYQLSRRYFGTWNNAMSAADYVVRENQTVTIPPISPEFCYFVGLVITDGHLYRWKRTRKVLIYTSYEEEKDIICSLVKYLFGYNPYIKKRKYGWNVLPNYEIHISSKDLVNFLNKKFQIPIGAKSLSVRVPKLFLNASTNYTSNFLRGVIDGDGCVKRGIDISSGSLRFLEDLNTVLYKLKITSAKISKRKTAYQLTFYPKDDVRRLYNLLYPAEFYYPRKRSDLSKLLKILN